jgi:hypothetical protein
VSGVAVDFGPVATAGGVRLTADGNALVVTPLPSDRMPEFSLRVKPGELPWKIADPTRLEGFAEDGTAMAREPMGREGDAIVITCRPGVFQYRLSRE